MLFRYVALFCLLFISQRLSAQDFLSKHLIIDTVIIEKDVDLEKLKNDKCEVEIFIGEYKFLDQEWNENRTSVSSKIYFIKNSSLQVGLKLDDNRSGVYLDSIEKLPDTIHINKWVVYHNKFADSIWDWVGYYHHCDTSIRLYKEKNTVHFSGKNEVIAPMVLFDLNNVSYKVSLEVKTMMHHSGIMVIAAKKTKKENLKDVRTISSQHGDAKNRSIFSAI